MESSSSSLKMSRKSLFFIVLLFSFTLRGEGKSIENQNFQSNVKNDSFETQGEPLTENFNPKIVKNEYPSGELTNHNNRVENSNERKSKSLSENNNRVCPYENKKLCLIFSLSKIAKVQVAASSKASTSRSNNFDNPAPKDVRNLKINKETRRKEGFDFGDEDLQNFSNEQGKSSIVHCRAIRDVYIPEVKRNLPAVACIFGNNTFVLSSERFLEDRRLYLDIRIDENVFENIKHNASKMSRSNESNVIPALLVLNTVNNNYRIETHKITSGEEEVNKTEGNR